MKPVTRPIIQQLKNADIRPVMVTGVCVCVRACMDHCRLAVAQRGSSAVECRTHNRGSLGLNPLCCRFEAHAFLLSPHHLPQLYK